MELVIEALQCDPVSPEKGVSLNCSHSNHSLLWTLRKLRMQDHRPQLAKVYKIWLNESWLLHLLLHRKALNFLAWDAASCVWSSIILSKIGTFPRGTKEVSTFKNTSTKSRHSTEYPSDKQKRPPSSHKIVVGTLRARDCNREELILNLQWICFCDFNLFCCFCYCKHT